MGKLRKRILGWAFSSLFIYWATPALFSTAGLTLYLEKKGEIAVPGIMAQRQVPLEFDARDYLNLSNSIVHRYKSSSTEWCKQMVDGTFDTYQQLVAANGRDDLENRVRVVADVLSDELHIWLQVKEQDKWVDYEPKTYTPTMPIREVRSYSRASLEQKSQLEAPTESNLVSLPGTQLMLPQAKLFEIRLPEYLRHMKRLADEARPYLQAGDPTFAGN